MPTPTEDDAPYSGGCLCGAVRFTVTEKPRWSAWCHCESCRRQTGSVVIPFIGVARAAVTFTGDKPQDFESSPGVYRSFCPRCGSAISYRSDTRADEMDLFAGSLDDPDRFAMRSHVHTAEQVSWVQMKDGLPCFTGDGSSP